MKQRVKYIIPLAFIIFCSSCSVIEKSSSHGFGSGYYQLKAENKTVEKVYADISDERITVYQVKENQLDKKEMMTVALLKTDTTYRYPLRFIRKSLDIDITSIILKYHPSVFHLPSQLTTDFNAAIYAGWRHDQYRVQNKINPLGRRQNKISNRGYDFGIFTGLGSTQINPFSTRNIVTNEYNGMIVQFGLAGFLESSIASFGIATGFDHLLSTDRNNWIYNKKPWLGFIIGIALN